jgi:hypothetical protein
MYIINVGWLKIDLIAVFCLIILIGIMFGRINVQKFTNVYEKRGFLPPKFLIFIGALSAFFGAFIFPNLIGK